MANLKDLIVNGAARIAGALHILKVNPNPTSSNNGTIVVGEANKVDTYRGVVELIPNSGISSTTGGGEIKLLAHPNATTKPGFAIEQYNDYLRVFGLASSDGTTVTGGGAPLKIDPYNAVIGSTNSNKEYTVNQNTAELTDDSTIKGANCRWVSRSHIYKKIVTVGNNGQIILNDVNRVYVFKPPSAAETITFSGSVEVNTQIYTFELWLNFTDRVASITWPSSVKWTLPGSAPSLTSRGWHLLEFTKIGVNSEWLGRLKGSWYTTSD